MRRFRRLVATASVLAIAVIVPGVVESGPTVHAQSVGVSGYYRTTYSDDVFQYINYGRGFARTRRLGFEEWVALGSPAPQVVASEVVKYPWSSTLYAVTFFDGDWVWRALSPDEWARMGFQQPRDAGWIEGSVIGRLGSSSELFLAAADGSLRKLSFGEWAATGFQPVTADWTSIGFVRFRNSPLIYLVFNYRTGNEQGVTISFDEWASYAFPTPELR